MNFGENSREINAEKNILGYTEPMDYELMMAYINEFSERYKLMSISSVGESIMGRSIPIITLGEGAKAALYVGAHHGMEWITTVLLLRFIHE